MSSLWTDLLFLHGHITDSRLARRLLSPAPPPEPSEPSPPIARSATTQIPLLQRLARRLCHGIGDGVCRTQ